ncbi:MAG: DoxX family protein, partial [Bdellovibrionales bacterium]|nr:DoxX family protein [Bdellovibrionales bacterium]
MLILLPASLISGIAFIGYGIQCLYSPFMISEFERLGQSRFRTLTGVLELVGGIGVILGLKILALGLFSSLGLCSLMAMGIVVRQNAKDSFTQCIPAFFFCALNAL